MDAPVGIDLGTTISMLVSADGGRYVNQVMIARNAPIPASASKAHSLTVPGGGGGRLEVHMLQGEAKRPLDNQPLGCWRFEGIESGRGGALSVDVAYEYDRDGVVQVSASVDWERLAEPLVDRGDRDLSWTDEEPGSHGGGEGLAVADLVGGFRGIARQLAGAGEGLAKR